LRGGREETNGGSYQREVNIGLPRIEGGGGGKRETRKRKSSYPQHTTGSIGKRVGGGGIKGVTLVSSKRGSGTLGTLHFRRKGIMG